MFIVIIFQSAARPAIKRVVGGFASREEAFQWCSLNETECPFYITEVEHYELAEERNWRNPNAA